MKAFAASAIPLGLLLGQPVTYNQPYAEQPRVALQLSGLSMHCLVSVDEKRLAQVLANLLCIAATRAAGVVLCS